MLNTIRNNLLRHLDSKDKLLAAISGGIDSMVLLHVLLELRDAGKLQFGVAHLNHQLRGHESDGDELLVQKTCRQYKITCITENADVNSISSEKNISTEMAAREARYDFFKQCSEKYGYNCIVMAHHANDQAETILMRLIRGASLTGLCGIRMVSHMNGMKLIRPMLNITRSEIEKYAQANCIIWREDSSNQQVDYLRNKLRHNILPVLNELNPAFVKNIYKTSTALQADDDFIDKKACKLYNSSVKNSLDFSEIEKAEPSLQNRVIRKWLSLHIPINQIDNQTINKIHKLYNSDKANCSLELPGNLILRKSYNLFSIVNTTPEEEENPESELMLNIQRMPITAEFKVEKTTFLVTLEKKAGIVIDRTDAIGKFPATASLMIPQNAELKIRVPRHGDRMTPLGMSGTKKLKDIFIDSKLPLQERKTIPIVVINNEIAWIPGYRISSKFKVISNSTPCWHITISTRRA